MKQTLTNLKKLWMLLLIAVATSTASAQCPDDGVFYDFDLTPAGPGQTSSFGCVYGGEFYLFNVEAGATYYISSCGTPWDSQLTLRDEQGNFIAYDDDSAPCGGGAAELTWTATYTGQVSVQINEFDCTSNTICGDLAVTWVDGVFLPGCTDPAAVNYNASATVDDGSCVFLEGCTNQLANNYNPAAVVDDGSCTFDLICDCSGTSHTAGVLTWLGDGFADDGAYSWEGQPVDFNCATWGYDCGDIVGAPANDPNAVCQGQLPPNNGCGANDVFGCTDFSANNFNPNATIDDGSCTYDILGCTDPAANNFDPFANVDNGSCTYGSCSNLLLDASQAVCVPDANGDLLPGVDFVFAFDGGCTVANLNVIINGTEFPFVVDAPSNISGSQFSLTGFPENIAFSAYYVLSDGTASDVFDFAVGNCGQDALICDCAGIAHTIGVLTWIGDAFADDGAYTWEGQPVDFNCATWSYDCGDIVGAPAEDPYGVCLGQLPPNNGCGASDVFGCTDPTANNYDVTATVNDGSCTYDVFGCTDPQANNYNFNATINDGSCTYDVFGCTDPQANNYNFNATINDGSCTYDVFGCMDPAASNYNMNANIDDGSCIYNLCQNLTLDIVQGYCQIDANDVLAPALDFTVQYEGTCTVQEIVFIAGGVEYPFALTAPNNVSGTELTYTFGENQTYAVYYTLSDGSSSLVYEFTTAPCSQDPVICDCAGTAHTIGVLSWIGDTFADDGAYTWDGQPVDFNCATWGYDCGDVVGAPAEDPNGVCIGNLPPNNGCTLDVLGCTDPTANNYNPNATINDGSCLYGACSNLVLTAEQTPCTQDANGVLNPGVDFTFALNGGCTITSIVVNLNGTDYPFDVVAPANVSGSMFPVTGFPVNSTFTAYYVLDDGTQSDVFVFTVGDCSQDPIICDCDGNQHTIGVLSWIGDTFADDGTYTWGGVPVNFNCATWGYDCGDVVGAPTEDTYGVCSGNIPPNNGCIADVLGCTDPLANNYNADATVNDGSCTYDVLGCTDPLANNYNVDATINDGSCTYDVLGCTDPSADNFNIDATIDDGSCSYSSCSGLMLSAAQMPCTPDANDVLNPSVDFVFTYNGDCNVASVVVVLGGTEYPFVPNAPDNVSGSVFSLVGFPSNTPYSAYYVLNDGTVSPTYNFFMGDCTLDASICDCAGTVHTIGVLSWIGDTFADNGAYTWGGQPVDFNCATWGYDCGDVVGAPTEDPYGVCTGNIPPNNGCTSDVVLGCTDITANNYNANATVNDGSCTYDVLGCTDATANNYNADATVNDGSCTYDVFGCTDVNANNYNPNATVNDGSCIYEVYGCTDANASNYNSAATVDDGSCIYEVYGCTDANASNYNSTATVDDGSCIYEVYGCTDANASNYNSTATVDDGSCTYDVFGCTDATANNYNANATVNDGSCTYDVFGCTDPLANNYNADATVDDGSCTYDVFGCTDPTANNYNPAATIDDGSCTYNNCSNLILTAAQTPCQQDDAGVLNPGVDFTFTLEGGCTVASIVVNLDGTEFPFDVVAPDNVSGSVFPLTGFPANSAFSAYYVLADGTVSDVFDFTVGDCSQDAIICDCDQNQHTIGVLSWIGDTFADDGAYTWAGVPVNFNCATWGYDCGDIAGAPAQDPYGVCEGNLPPDNGCGIIAVEEITSMNIEAYPNPTSGMITLVNRGEGGSKQIRVFDQTGKLQFAEQRTMAAGSSEMFNLSALAAGTYHVQVVGNSGVSNITVIVQK